MVKTGTSKKLKFSFKPINTVEINGQLHGEYDPLEWLLNEENTMALLAECVKKNDLKGALETMGTYQFARKTARKIAKAKALNAESNTSNVSSSDQACDTDPAIEYSFSGNSRSKL